MDFRDCAKWRIPDVQCASGMTPVGAKSVALLGSKSRPCAVPAVSDAWRLQATVRLLLRSRDENLGARLHVILAAYDIGDNDRVGAHNQFLLAILVFDGQRRPIDPGNRLFDVAVGHFALWLEIPVVMASILGRYAPRWLFGCRRPASFPPNQRTSRV